MAQCDDLAPDILARYFGEQCTPDERAMVERWIAQDAAHQLRVAEMRRIWERSQHLMSSRQVDAAWHSVRGRIAVPFSRSTVMHPTSWIQVIRDRTRVVLPLA